MGRWAQRTRSGGGQAPAVVLVRMSSGSATGPTTIVVIYTGDLDASALEPNDFIEPLSGDQAILCNQASPSAIEFVFPGSIDGATELDYSGTTPGL